METLTVIFLFIVITIGCISGFYLLVKRRSTPYSIQVFLILIGVVLWATSNYLFQITTSRERGFFVQQNSERLGTIDVYWGATIF
ncbi:MAG: hypothetical protein KatS3mg084_0493 [Candidatus Dojkabacteria bacterium]|nr:MAG: hypothetical protein KatS3mg084_0493 [Candidatus Dojkabacteria bacterium]